MRRTLLEEAFQFCDGCPGAGASVQAWCGFLEEGEIGTHVFYVASPGRRVQQIEAEAQFAERVATSVRGLDDLRGRRAVLVRRVWDRLSAEDRDFAMQVPQRPFWERLRLLERPLGALYDLLARPAFVLGWLTIVRVAAQAAAAPCARSGAPQEVIDAAAYWTLRCCALSAGRRAWFAQFIGEFPAELTAGMRWRVIAVKVGEFFRATLCAVPGFAALLGLIAFAHWHRPLLVLILKIAVSGALLLLLALAAVWAVRLMRIALRSRSTWSPDWNADPCARSAAENGYPDHLATGQTIRRVCCVCHA